MSGTGKDDFRAPTRLTPITGDQPIATDDTGRQSKATMWFLQFLQRILSYIGQPVASSRPGATLSGQIGSLNNEMGVALFQHGADAAALERITALEQEVARLTAAAGTPARHSAPLVVPSFIPGGEWNAGYVATVGENLSLSSGTLSLQHSPTITSTGTATPVIVSSGSFTVPALPQVAFAVTGTSGGIRSTIITYGGNPQTSGARAQGTQSSPTAVTAGLALLSTNCIAYDGTAWSGAQAGLNLVSLNNWGTADHSTYMLFLTTPSGSTTLTEVARLTGGHLLIGTTIDDGVNALQVNGSANIVNTGTVGTLVVGSSTAFSAFSTHFSVTSSTLDVTGFGTGSVTSVATSGTGVSGGPITTSGTLTVEWNGGTVDALATGLSISSTTLTPQWQAGAATTIGSGVTLTSGTLSAAGSGGTVTDVVTSGAGISGGPITTTGTLTVEWNAGTVTALNANELQLSSGTLQFITGPTVIAATSNPMVINANTAVPTPLSAAVLQLVGKDATNPILELDSFGSVNAGQVLCSAASGTEGSPAAVVAGQQMGAFGRRGYNGTTYGPNRAGFAINALNNWTTADNSSYLVFNNVLTGSTNTTEGMRLVNAHLLIGTTTDNGTDLAQVNGSSTQTQVKRTTTAASAGYVGEYVVDSVVSGSAVALTAGTIANMGSIVLTAGDWDINAEIALTGTSTTTITTVKTAISTTSATLSTTPGFFSNMNLGAVSLGTLGEDPTANIIGGQVTAAATYYATVNATFAIGTLNAYGLIQARRR